jgi:transposase-like protein
MATNLSGVSTETLHSALDIYYARLTSWNTSEAKKQKYLIRIDEITNELKKRETIQTLNTANKVLVEMFGEENN